MCVLRTEIIDGTNYSELVLAALITQQPLDDKISEIHFNK